jgi:uncharacterized protein (AIM24 family)
VTRTEIGGEVEGTDEEFLFHLSRGSDLLSKGESEPARASLERALGLRPRDAKVLGLLGQAYYRLGLYERSAEVYQKVVDENPTEATAHVNLGLANLKAKRLAEAVRQLTIALDLHPGHKKAMGYLGLALLDSGEPGRAREWFVKAGSEAGVARCDEVLSGRTPAPEPAAVPEEPAEPAPVAQREPFPPPGRQSGTYPALAFFAGVRQARETADAPFAEDGETLVITVRDTLYTRVDGLYAVRGAVELTPAMKQFRGQTTDSPFGEERQRMHRASGAGTLHVAAGGRRFTALDLGGEAGYFKEETVFAFEGTVSFENGRVTARAVPDLNLVHLRGNGRFLLVTRGAPAVMEVTGQEPLRVPPEALIGWLGGITPRVVLLPEPPAGTEAQEQPGLAMVELAGDGRALVDPTATLERAPRA